MLLLPTVSQVGYYFDKKRPIAMGISMCGAGAGIFAIAPLARYLQKETDWKTAHFVYGKLADD